MPSVAVSLHDDVEVKSLICRDRELELRLQTLADDEQAAQQMAATGGGRSVRWHETVRSHSLVGPAFDEAALETGPSGRAPVIGNLFVQGLAGFRETSGLLTTAA